jgi:hypothetical protein
MWIPLCGGNCGWAINNLEYFPFNNVRIIILER